MDLNILFNHANNLLSTYEGKLMISMVSISVISVLYAIYLFSTVRKSKLKGFLTL